MYLSLSVCVSMCLSVCFMRSSDLRVPVVVSMCVGVRAFAPARARAHAHAHTHACTLTHTHIHTHAHTHTHAPGWRGPCAWSTPVVGTAGRGRPSASCAPPRMRMRGRVRVGSGDEEGLRGHCLDKHYFVCHFHLSRILVTACFPSSRSKTA